MNRKDNYIVIFFLLFVLLLPACGGKNTAATMHLVRTEGAVSVNDTDGAPVTLIENLGLYSGYGVATRAESYGWIDLDETKLAKMDENSEVEIVKSDKLLEVRVQSGGLFFNVTEPLADDETMNIRTSTMLVGIRGTCGWVYVEDDNLMRVYLLRGKVECSVLGEDDDALASKMLTAGQMARMSLSGDTASILIEDFSDQDVPSFVMTEIEEDAAMLDSIRSEEPDPAEEPDDNPDGGADVPGGTAGEDTGLADEDADPVDEDAGITDEDANPADEDAGLTDEDANPAGEDTGAAAEDPAPADEDAGQTSQPSNSDILEQYKAIVAQGKSYDYTSDLSGFEQELKDYKYALYQESGFSAPTLILEAESIDYKFYLLFRYDAGTGTTSQVDRDRASRFETNRYKFLTDISLNNDWHSLTDTSYLESWLS